MPLATALCRLVDSRIYAASDFYRGVLPRIGTRSGRFVRPSGFGPPACAGFTAVAALPVFWPLARLAALLGVCGRFARVAALPLCACVWRPAMCAAGPAAPAPGHGAVPRACVLVWRSHPPSMLGRGAVSGPLRLPYASQPPASRSSSALAGRARGAHLAAVFWRTPLRKLLNRPARRRAPLPPHGARGAGGISFPPYGVFGARPPPVLPRRRGKACRTLFLAVCLAPASNPHGSPGAAVLRCSLSARCWSRMFLFWVLLRAFRRASCGLPCGARPLGVAFLFATFPLPSASTWAACMGGADASEMAMAGRVALRRFAPPFPAVPRPAWLCLRLVGSRFLPSCSSAGLPSSGPLARLTRGRMRGALSRLFSASVTQGPLQSIGAGAASRFRGGAMRFGLTRVSLGAPTSSGSALVLIACPRFRLRPL